MNKLQLILSIFIASLWLSGCGSSVISEIDSVEKNKEITVASQTLYSEIAESENNSIAHTKQKEKHKIIIDNLADGNYQFCSDAHPNETKPDVHRYCFDFTKTGDKIIGSYLYRAPKDTPIICLEGVVENNLVNGVGYESTFGAPEPLTEKDFAYLEDAQYSSSYSYWDDSDVFQGGFNLKVSLPNLHSLMPPSEDKFATYWAVIRYDMVQLDLTNFEEIETEREITFEECYEKNM